MIIEYDEYNNILTIIWNDGDRISYHPNNPDGDEEMIKRAYAEGYTDAQKDAEDL